MNTNFKITIIVLMLNPTVFLTNAFSATENYETQELTGDPRLACEAILCLSTGNRPDECSQSLNRYFSINKKKLKDTIKARADFLELCPASKQTPEMMGLVQAISQGAGRCDATFFNNTLFYQSEAGGIYISDRMPDYCTTYTNNAYTDFNNTRPRYVGTPEKGGYWVEGQDYEKALAEYQAKLLQLEEQKRRQEWSGG